MTTTLLFGELRTGRITDTLDVTGCSWSQENNDAGAISNATVPMREVRVKDLRQAAPAARSYLAVDVDGEVQEAGPIWSRVRGEDAVTLGAAGLWSLFDHRKVLPVLVGNQRPQDDESRTTVVGTDLGGIARALVAQAMTHAGGNLPLVLPPQLTGDRTETFHGWELSWVGDELRQLTQREAFSPDLRFRPRYTADRMGIEWVMEAGTEDAPLLTQMGEDWYFDASVPKSTVVSIQTDEDATAMGMQAWVTGNGMEQDIRIAQAYDPALVDAGWPLLEVDETRSTVTDTLTLLGHAVNLRDRSARPVEVWKVRVQASAAAQVLAGHYAHVTAHPDDAWLKGEQAFMRVKSKSGDLGETITLDMYSVAGRI